MKTKIIKIILILLVLIPSISKADTYKLIEPLPCIDGTANCTPGSTTGSTTQSIDLGTYINYIFKFSIALAAFLAVVMIIWGGFQYMISEAVSGKLEGKGKIWNAITGLIMILSSYLILRTIDPRLVQIYSEIPPIGIKIDSSTTGVFNNMLTEDLRQLNADTLKTVNQANDEKTKASTDLKTLESDYAAGKIDEEEYQIKKATLQSSINQKSFEIAQNITSITARNNVKEVVIQLRESPAQDWWGASSPDWTIADRKIQETNDFYKKYEDQLTASNNLEGVTKLETERVFYTDQIKEELSVTQTADKYYQDQSQKSKDEVQKMLNYYQKEYDTVSNPQNTNNNQYKSNQILNDQYKSLVELRISYLKSVLEKTKI